MAVVYFGGRTLPRAWQRLNTDFPNYYITARLLREDYRTDRAYEWIWLQRQKDHLGIKASEQPVVGFVPHTPFSALVMWPLTYWKPLAAKHIWIVVNLGLLVVIGALLQSMTALGWRRIALLMAVNYPMHRNLEFGQYYIVMLLIVTLGLWLYLRDKRTAAGMAMGIGFGLKIFPALFLLYFARKNDLRAVVGLAAGGAATFVASIWAFGPMLHRTYLSQVLPWALRGDAMDPYNLSASSLSSLLHKLFLFEPGWNPHPAFHSPILFAVLHPLLQIALLAPAILLARPKDRTSQQLQLEWGSFLLALLAISTLPASYHFTLLILPLAVVAGALIKWGDYRSLGLLLILYLAICFPAWHHEVDSGWWALLAVPRLSFVILLCVLSYVALRREDRGLPQEGNRWLWPAILAVAVVAQIGIALHHQRGMFSGNAERIESSPDVLLATEPTVQGSSVLFTGMLSDGYRNGVVAGDSTAISVATADQLSQSSAGTVRWTEETGEQSRIVPSGLNGPSAESEIDDAEFPVASADGRFLAYLRSTKGTSRMWLHPLREHQAADIPLTPEELDVREMTFLPDGSLIFAAALVGGEPRLYAVNLRGEITTVDKGTARYPAASPDGRWLAYSQLERGVWNLWLRNLQSGDTRRLTSAECNDLSPVWEPDSRTLIYASDCGRALWFTALYRKRVIP